MSQPERISRRRMLGTLGILGAAGATGALTLSVPGRAEAQALGVHESVEAGLQRLFGSRLLKDGAGVVKLDVPLIAENGAVVPVSVEVASPMTAQNHVKHIYVVADKNRIPIITRATLGPQAGQALVGATVRLGETGDVRAIVEQSDGTLLQVKREVKVTVSGCGG
jgi:sulfur-oxidizing protein SoxY